MQISKIAIWSAVALLTPLFLYGVNEGYSVITENSSWGIVMGLDESVDYRTEPVSNWDSLYCPRLDSMQSCGLSWVRPNYIMKILLTS